MRETRGIRPERTNPKCIPSIQAKGMSQEVAGLEERVCDLVIHINLCVSFFRTSSVSSMRSCFIILLKIASM